MGRRSRQDRAGKQWVEGKSFRLGDEVRYIQNKSAEHDGRVVSIAQLVLFSTDTGDAWLLDVSDQLAAPLARDGTRNCFLYRRPTAASPSDGKATIALKDPIERSNPI